MKDSVTFALALFGKLHASRRWQERLFSLFDEARFLGIGSGLHNLSRVRTNNLNHLSLLCHIITSRKSLKNIMLAVLINPFVSPESLDLRWQSELHCRPGQAIQVTGETYVPCAKAQEFSRLKSEGREAEARALTFAAP